MTDPELLMTLTRLVGDVCTEKIMVGEGGGGGGLTVAVAVVTRFYGNRVLCHCVTYCGYATPLPSLPTTIYIDMI